MGDDTSIGISDSAERIEFDGAGDISVLGANFGIGTSSPGYALDILDSTSPQLNITSSSSDDTAKYAHITCGHYHNSEEPMTMMEGRSDGSNNYTRIGGGRSEGNSTNIIEFYTGANDATTGGTEKMRIDSSGNLFIKTTTAASTNGQSLPGYLEFQGFGWDTNSGSDAIGGRITLGGSYSGVTSGGVIPHLAFAIQNSGDAGATSETMDEHMRIVGNGNVGIGTTAPYPLSNYKFLSVSAATGGGLICMDDGTVKGGVYNAVDDMYYDTTTNHIFRTGANEGLGGTERMRINSNGEVQFSTAAAIYHDGTGRFRINDAVGSATEPTYSFTSDTGTGMYRPSAAQLSFATGGTHRMSITSSGTVGIGVTDPPVDFVVKGSDPHIRIWDYSPSEWWSISVGQAADGRLQIDDTDNDNGVYMNQNDTSWTSSSDERLKTNWTAFDDALGSINSLTKVGTFQYTKSIEDQTPKNDAVHSGLSAQEVQKFLPSSVSEDNDGILGLQYQHLIPVLVKSIQELTAKVEALENA